MTSEKVPGPGVDASGRPVVDPTDNVRALNEAANKRQDDLRAASEKYVDAEIRHLSDIAMLRAEHAKEIREIESNRLNAIRQVDVLAGNTSADRALTAIQTLAATTTANADTLRNMVATTATTIATQTTATVQAITERLAALEKSSYEGKGKQSYSDPMLADMMTELRSLRESRSVTTGKSAGYGILAGVIFACIAALGTLSGLIYLVATHH